MGDGRVRPSSGWGPAWRTSPEDVAVAGPGDRDRRAGRLVRPGAIVAAAPFLLAWLVSPLAAYPQPARLGDAHRLTEAERRALRRVARKTWLFFETFVGDADHWLPPDNFQEIPDGRIAHRTSPTNMGLLLLSTLSASDLGYIGLRQLVERLEKTFDTLERPGEALGPLLQLVPDRDPPAAAAEVHLDGRQRQPAGLLLTLAQG